MQQQSGTMEFLSGVSFTDADHGTAVGIPGIIVRTTNGGENGVSENSGTIYGLSKVSCSGPRSGTTVVTEVPFSEENRSGDFNDRCRSCPAAGSPVPIISLVTWLSARLCALRSSL